MNSQHPEVLKADQERLRKVIKAWAEGNAHDPGARFEVRCNKCGSFKHIFAEDYEEDLHTDGRAHIAIWLACEDCDNKVRVL